MKKLTLLLCAAPFLVGCANGTVLDDTEYAAAQDATVSDLGNC